MKTSSGNRETSQTVKTDAMAGRYGGNMNVKTIPVDTAFQKWPFVV